MSVHMRAFGLAVSKLNDADLMDLTEQAQFDDKWEPGFIRLTLQPGVLRGNGRVNVLAFQHLVLRHSQGTGTTGFLSEVNGKPGFQLPTVFQPDNLGRITTYIPDTEFNRAELIRTLHFSPAYKITSKDVLKEITPAADIRLAKNKYALSVSLDKATKLVEADRALTVKGMQERIGTGFRESREYREDLGDLIDRAAKKEYLALIDGDIDSVVIPEVGESSDASNVQLGDDPTFDEIGAMDRDALKEVAKTYEVCALNESTDKMRAAIVEHFGLTNKEY